MKTTTEIKKEWGEYDRFVAKGQLESYGVIFLDDYGCPIDDEFETEELFERWEEEQ